MRHTDETANEYLQRIAHNLAHEHSSLLDDLPTIESLVEYFELWDYYDTDLMVGIEEAILDGSKSIDRLKEFILKYSLDWDLSHLAQERSEHLHRNAYNELEAIYPENRGAKGEW